MGNSQSASGDVEERSDEEEALRQAIEEWLEVRAKTILALTKVVSDLESLHRQAVYCKLGGGMASVMGGVMAVGSAVSAFLTGGGSLLVTGAGLALVAGGAATGGMTDMVESIKEKVKSGQVQKTLERDKEKQAEIFAKFEHALDNLQIEKDKKALIEVSYKKVIVAIKDLWLSSSYMYGWAKSSKAVYSAVQWTKAGTSWLAKGTVAAASVAGGLAGSVFLLVDLGSVIHYSMAVRNGSHSDAANVIRDLLAIMKHEREEILKFFKSLPKSKDPYVPLLSSTVDDVIEMD